MDRAFILALYRIYEKTNYRADFVREAVEKNINEDQASAIWWAFDVAVGGTSL